MTLYRISAKLARCPDEYFRPGNVVHVPTIAHWCPACRLMHHFATDIPFRNGSKWHWNGDTDRPTMMPSMNIGCKSADPGHTFRCHYFLRAGVIEFQADCSHAMAGQHVEMPDIPDSVEMVRHAPFG